MSCSVKQRVIMKTVYDPHIPFSFKSDVMHSTGGGGRGEGVTT